MFSNTVDNININDGITETEEKPSKSRSKEKQSIAQYVCELSHIKQEREKN